MVVTSPNLLLTQTSCVTVELWSLAGPPARAPLMMQRRPSTARPARPSTARPASPHFFAGPPQRPVTAPPQRPVTAPPSGATRRASVRRRSTRSCVARSTFDAESLALARERQQLIHDTARVLRGCVFGVWTATPPRDGGDCDSSTSSSSSESSLELYDDHCASPVVEVPPPPSSPPPGWVAPAAASDERITVIRHPTTRRLSAVLRDDAHVTAATLEVTPPPRAPVVLPSDPFARVGRAARTREPFAVDKAWVKRMLSVNERRLHAVSDPATETMAAEEGPPPRNCAALERYIGTLESDAAARRKFMQHCRQLRDARAAPESAARCATPRLADGGGCSAFEKLRSQRQAQARKAHRQRKDPSYGPAPGTITRADQRRLRNRRGREALQIAAVATAAMRFARTLQTLKTLRSVVLWVQRTWRHRMLQRTLELRRRMLDKDNTILLTAARKRWASSQDMHAHILCMFLRQARFNASPEAHARAPPQTPPPRCPPQSLSRQCSSGGATRCFAAFCTRTCARCASFSAGGGASG